MPLVLKTEKAKSTKTLKSFLSALDCRRIFHFYIVLSCLESSLFALEVPSIFTSLFCESGIFNPNGIRIRTIYWCVLGPRSQTSHPTN